MSPTRAIIVFGSGPGIGNHVAAEFSSHNFTHVVLLARNEQRLSSEDAPFVTKAAPNVKVDTLRIDLSDLASIPAVLKQIEQLTQGEHIEVVFFNAARIQPSDVLATLVEEIEEDFKTTNLALYLIAQWAVPLLQSPNKSTPLAKPALLVTNSFLPANPIPQLLSLSLVKASQRNMVQNLAQAITDIHIGLVNVGGVVSPGAKSLSPKNIAEKTWAFYEAGRGWEVDIRE